MRKASATTRIIVCLGTVVAPVFALLSGIHAEEERKSVQLFYDAPSNCPASRAFFEQILGRSRRLRLSDSTDSANRLTVKISRSSSGYSGSLLVRDPSGAESERNMEASSCSELVSGLAFIATVALDPSLLPPNSASAVASDSSAPPASASASESTSSAPHQPGSAPSSSSQPSHFSVGLGAEALWGPLPKASLVLPLTVEFSKPGAKRFFPILRAAIGYGASSTESLNPGASFSLVFGRLEACHVVAAQSLLNSALCLRGEIGAFSGQGQGVTPVRSSHQLWLSVGPAARIRLKIMPKLSAEAQGAVSYAALRDRYYVRPNTTVFESSPLEASVALGLALEIW